MRLCSRGGDYIDKSEAIMKCFNAVHRWGCGNNRDGQMRTVILLSLDGDGSFRANRGSETIITVGNKQLLGATVRSTAFNLQPPSHRAKLPGALAPP